MGSGEFVKVEELREGEGKGQGDFHVVIEEGRWLTFKHLLACLHQLEIAKYPVNFRLHQPEVAISGIFGRDNHPKISWGSLQNTLLLVQCVFTSPKTLTMRER